MAVYVRRIVGDVTKLLVRIAQGDLQAWDELYPLTEPELRKLALHWIKRNRARGRVRTTVVIDDAFVKLMRFDSPSWQHRGAFYMFASRNILRIVIDELRRLGRLPPPSPIDPDESVPVDGLSLHTLLTLQQALVDLGQTLSETHRVVVELRFLGEFTLDEVAEQLSIGRDRVFRMSKIALEYMRERLAPSFPDLGHLARQANGD
jgi:RNA polymerase sigma factor (sigma-70 family)